MNRFLMITGKLWNEQMSARAYLDGSIIDDIRPTKGNNYGEAMLRQLERKGLTPKRTINEEWWDWEKRVGIKVRFDVSNVRRKCDL